MDETMSRRIANVICEFAKLYPDWRIGQIFSNISGWATGGEPGAFWNVTDEGFVTAAEAHLAHRRATLSKSKASSADAASRTPE